MIPALILFALAAYNWAGVGAHAVVARMAQEEGEDGRPARTRLLRCLTLAVIFSGLAAACIIALAG